MMTSPHSVHNAHPEPGTAPGAEPSTQEGKNTLHRSILGSALGNAVEWFDYGVYGYLTIYMAVNFFGSEEGDGGLGVTLTLATLALSFLVRPLGGLILGPLGDKVGRQKIMVLTVTLMTAATGAIGLLPTLETAGLLAPVLLLVCRLVQGFSAGGEYGGAAVYMAESAPDRRRGFLGSFLEFGTTVGFMLAAIVCTTLITIVGDDGMEAGWWRLPFLLTIPLGLTALWIRTRLVEAPVFSEASQHKETMRSPLRHALKHNWRQLLVLAGFVVLLNVAFYLILGYMPTYLSGQLGHSTAQGNWMLVAIMALMLLAIPPVGALSDRVGRKPLLLAAALGYTLLSVPAVMLLGMPSLALQFLGLAVLGFLLVILVSSVSSTLPALFPTAVRYTGFAIAYNFSTAFFAGPSQTVANQLIETTGNQLVPGWYMALAGVVGLVSILCMRETAQATLRGEELPGDPRSVGLPKREYVELNRADAQKRRDDF
ncbi:MFS transporter, MHS family, proline/betaine transporter [Arthrobacter subterraneus]|uniref:Putative proline/betaine transporter n=1 Tax=Arthrobacter subterraneus TaxID=335973 RepID=A0A1G8KLG3_9MICC|nr:MFS transporter [Arthrobacter subterraneus]SDI43730.1 MFS transporter, MHS family, proline/betaine transporter [Arthrobacter subterraneus]